MPERENGESPTMQRAENAKLPGVSAAVLKWTAVLTMLIDHVGASLLWGVHNARHGWGDGVFSEGFYSATRVVGRLAFPVFCFLLVEGLFHTRSRWKYLLRLGLFALLSELPFDRALFGSWLDMKAGQNVFFTLFLGLAACAAWEWLTEGNNPACNPLRGIAAMLAAAAAVYLAILLNTDYGGLGVALILVMYLLRDKPYARDLLCFGVLYLMVRLQHSHWIELLAAFSFPLLHCYNGQRGRQNKYFFYIFYPAHLLLFAGILILL